MPIFRARETRIQRQRIRLHHEGAIRGALKAVNDHKAGIPEFIKNSAGAYARLPGTSFVKRTQENRIIVLLFRNPRGRGGGIIGCLDLVGMTPVDIQSFNHWFDPTAASRGDPAAELWGGHGNGAKSYMLQMFDQSWFATVRDDRYTRMGWDSNNLEIGYMPSKAEADRIRVTDPLDQLNELLRACFKTDLEVLPTQAKQILRRRPCWTCFVALDAKNWVNPNRLIEVIQNNPQAIRAIEYCSIYAIINGQIVLDNQPMALREIPPLPGGEDAFEIEVPHRLQDPDGGEVDTTHEGQYPIGKLVLRTSREAMLYGLRHRHIIRCESIAKGVIAMYQVDDLAGRQADHIYGELYLERLRDYETNFRNRPHDAPLTRAVEAWLREQVVSYANRFRVQEQDRFTDEERNELQQMNQEMNRFLQDFLEETEAEIGITNGGDNQVITGLGRSSLPEGEVASIEHSLGEGVHLCGSNITLYIRLNFFDADRKHIRPLPVHWESSDEAVAYAQLGSIITGQPGECQVWAVAQNGVRSQPIYLKVININSIEIDAVNSPLSVGSKQYLQYRVASDGDMYSGVKLDWHSSNKEYVKVGSNVGIVTATAAPGSAQVWACAYGVESNRIELNTTGESGEGDRLQYPKVLLSELDVDPDTGVPKSVDQDAGTIVQDIADRRRNIYWVNMKSPIADQFYKSEGGLSYRSPEFRVYLAERYAEVVFRDPLRRGRQWEPDDVEELLRDRPTRFRQALARHFREWLIGEWCPQ